MHLAEPVQVTHRIAQTFENLGIQYLVGGSLASSLHGIPRATQDVDIVADIKPNQVAPLVNKLQGDFYIDADMIQDAIKNHSSFNIIHLATMFKVDIFILKPDHNSQQEMMRREPYQLSDNPKHLLYLATAEDIIIHKLYWYQLSGSTSERQWHDVLGVIQVQGDQLDYVYLKQTAQQREVSELVEQILKDASKL